MSRNDEHRRRMGPLTDGQTVAMIGGGPGGIACALTLKRHAELRGMELRVLVFEGKQFGLHYNQCAGVLSPPLQQLLAQDFDIHLPPRLLQRVVHGYVLHAGGEQVVLNDAEQDGPSVVTRRVEFDEFLQQCARERGVEIIPSYVSDLEFREQEVIVYAWSGTFRATAIVGAFGPGRAIAGTLAKHTAYRPPRALETLVTKIHPAGRVRAQIPHLLDDQIHVLLPPMPRIEFAALIPKGNHITAIIAGERLSMDDMEAVLALPAVRPLIAGSPQPGDYFKGGFPVGLARGIFGDRYVTIGDAAGLVRPFKGKGINSAIITGRLAALTMLDEGVSADAFRTFARRCSALTDDIKYGRLMRKLTWLAAHTGAMTPIVREAQHNPALRALLFDCVSGHGTYRGIIRRRGNLQLALRLGLASLTELLHPRR